MTPRAPWGRRERASRAELSTSGNNMSHTVNLPAACKCSCFYFSCCLTHYVILDARQSFTCGLHEETPARVLSGAQSQNSGGSV